MKKLSLFLGATAMAAASFAGLPVNIFFSTQGPDLYGDGKVVEDGEIYALVWTADNATFGINADGSLVDPVNTKVIGKIRAGENGHCALSMFSLDNGDQDLVGTFSVYLFDTRVVAEDGTVEVNKKDAEGKYVSLNSVQKVDATIVKQGGVTINVDSSKATDGETGYLASVLPADVPNPVVNDITVDGGEVKVAVGETRPNVRYALSASKDLGGSATVLANGVSGSADGKDITLSVSSSTDYKFFKVVRSK